MKKHQYLQLFCLLFGTFSYDVVNLTATAIPVPNAEINFNGAGGIFTSRSAQFSVPNKTTTTSVGNGLRLYEVHIAKMIELTHNFCGKERPSSYIVYWDYSAGETSMGRFSFSCQFAAKTFKIYGTGKPEQVTISHRGNIVKETITTLNLSGSKGKQFANLVKTIKPK
jgi:hypothetical protein